MATFVTNPMLMKGRIFSTFNQHIKRTSPWTTSSASKMSQINVKPPNILVYKPKSADSAKSVCMIEKCLPGHTHVVYDLPCERAYTDPWMENCQFLVIPAVSSPDCNLLKKYLSKGGKIINFSTETPDLLPCPVNKSSHLKENFRIIEQETEKVVVTDGCWSWDAIHIEKGSNCFASEIALYVEFEDGTREVVAAIFEDKNTKGQLFYCSLPALTYADKKMNHACKILRSCFCCFGIMEAEIPSELSVVSSKLTPCFLLCSQEDKLADFLRNLGINEAGYCEVKGGVSLRFVQAEGDIPETTPTYVPVFYQQNATKINRNLSHCFDMKTYLKHLRSREFGKLLFYSDVVTSTMDILATLDAKVPPDMSVTCVARQQISGRGRGGNKWLSPLGTAMFSLTVSIPLDSRLGRHLTLLQHIVTVAVVRAIRYMPGLHHLDLRVKWPNDIYFGTRVKIGGVIVKSTILRGRCVATIGCGVNVDNVKPTTCVNDILQAFLPEHRRLTCEEVLARSITSLEQLIEKYQDEGPEQFLAFYYKYWIHGGSEVKVQLPTPEASSKEPCTVDATIVGLDSDGFLRVIIKDGQEAGGQTISLQPDGNSFDITKNLIAMKIAD